MNNRAVEESVGHGHRFVGTWTSLFGAAALALTLNACVFLPFALPPTRLTVAAGGASGGILARPEKTLMPGTTERRTSAALISIRGAVHPLQALQATRVRPFDIGTGYMADMFIVNGRTPFSYHGPYVELSLMPVGLQPGNGSSVRFFLSGAAELLIGDLGYGVITGWGVTTAITVEALGFRHGLYTQTPDPGRHSTASFLEHGEAAIGFQVALSTRHLGGEDYWAATAGVTVRIPEMAGIVGWWL